MRCAKGCRRTAKRNMRSAEGRCRTAKWNMRSAEGRCRTARWLVRRKKGRCRTARSIVTENKDIAELRHPCSKCIEASRSGEKLVSVEAAHRQIAKDQRELRPLIADLRKTSEHGGGSL